MKSPSTVFIDTYNDVAAFPKLNDVANFLFLSVKTVKNKAAMLRQTNPEILTNERAAGTKTTEVPMSEVADKIHDPWTAAECIDELRRICNIDRDKVISRNYFRVHGRIAESVWNVHFGTFEEFKRQANVKLSRQVHALERQIAKHASVDHYRTLSVDRVNWGARYVRDNPKRFKTVLAASDLHDVEIDPFYLRCLIATAKRLQPDVLVLGGDVFDLPEFGKYGVDPREWDVSGRIKFVHTNILTPLRQVCPDMQIDLIEGNHEARLLRHLADASPAMRAVLADLHGMTISKLLGLDEFEVNYIAKGDLAAWNKADFNRELGNNYKIYFESFMWHHFPYGKDLRIPGCNGHAHKHVATPFFSPIYGAYTWNQIGSGHIRQASYCEGEKWHNGFQIEHIDSVTHQTVAEYIAITDFACIGGQYYQRTADEMVHGVPPTLLRAAH